MSSATLPAIPNGQGTPSTITARIDHNAVLKAVGLNLSDPNAQALLLTCERYGLDPILKHMVLIQGRPYVTRDGLLHVAHCSGQFDGIEVKEQGETQTHFTAMVSVYRKDMSRPFTYIGRYPKNGGNKLYGPEMAVKCGEVMAFRRAFNVALCAREEVWDQVQAQEPIDVEVEAHREVNESFPQREAPDRDAAPGSGKALFAWLKEQEQRLQIGLLKYINGWAKLQDFPGRMVDWDQDQVALAYGEAIRRLRAIQEPKPLPADDDTDPMPEKRPAAETWASFIAKTCSERRDYWNAELAMANVPQAERVRAENQMPDQHQVVNHMVTHAIGTGALKVEALSKDGTADGPRDPSKAKAAMADLFARAPRKIRQAVSAYFLEKEQQLRVRLGMDDLDDASGQDGAEDTNQEAAEAAGREAGSDDDR